MSFVFYDTETTGTDTTFDQILQFAAIKTDADLNEIDRFNFRCRLHQHIVPSAGAMRVTGVTVAQLTDPTLPSHYEMIRQVREKLLAWSPAIFCGYNSMKFDENLLRQALYQTLHSPYLTNTNSNCRADVMDLAKSVVFLHPESLVVPNAANGKPTFRLDQLAPANGFEHSNAHDALADVEATIHICKLIRDACPDAWSNFTRYSQKTAAIEFMNEGPFFYLAHYFQPCPYAVTVLEFDAQQSSLAYALDLSFDLPTLAGLSDVKLAAKLKGSPKPVRQIKANAAPFVLPLDDVPAHAWKKLPSLDVIAMQVEWLAANPDFVTKLLNIFKNIKDDYEPSAYVEKKIYDGFLADGDSKRLDAFHAAPWEERLEIVHSLSDERYKELGLRLMHSERPDLLPPEIKAAIDAEHSTRLLGSELGGEPWLTLNKALVDTNDFLANATGDEHTLLTDLAAYLTARIEQLSSC